MCPKTTPKRIKMGAERLEGMKRGEEEENLFTIRVAIQQLKGESTAATSEMREEVMAFQKATPIRDLVGNDHVRFNELH
jgi:hypothetical protein